MYSWLEFYNECIYSLIVRSFKKRYTYIFRLIFTLIKIKSNFLGLFLRFDFGFFPPQCVDHRSDLRHYNSKEKLRSLSKLRGGAVKRVLETKPTALKPLCQYGWHCFFQIVSLSCYAAVV